MMRHWRTCIALTGLMMALIFMMGCAGDNEDSGSEVTGSGSTTVDCSSSTTAVQGSFADGVPAWIQDNFYCVDVTVSGNDMTFTFKNMPPYQSYYYGTGHSLYDATVPEKQIPNKISEQAITLTVPMNPAIAVSSTATQGGAIGVTSHGVSIFNNAANPPDVLADEVPSMDVNSAHPTGGGIYHHHTEPVNITNMDSNLVGVALDGFPIYGKLDEGGSTPVFTGEVDNWHEHATTLFPGGIPHYHIVDGNFQFDSGSVSREVSYLIGTSFGGTPGTRSGT